MTQITSDQRRRYGPLLTGMVPADVLARIGRTELEDRLEQASGLMQKVAKAATPGGGRPFGQQAARILAARPRDQTEQLVAAKIHKARLLGDSSPQAEALRRSAREELLAHPPAVRRFDPARIVKKAKDDGALFACFDSAGKLYGIVDPAEIQLVDDDGSDPAAAAGNAAPAQPASPQQAPPASTAAPVAKAKAAAKKPMKSVYDQQGRLIGLVDPDAVQGVLTTIPGAAEASAQPAGAPPAAGVSQAAAADVVNKAVAQARWQLDQASRPHVYARDVGSRTAACVCKSAMRAPIHTELAPGVRNPAARR